MSERLLRAEQVCLMVGCSVPTLNMWYRFKRTNPDSEYAKMIPSYTQSGPLQTRYWTENDVYKLIEFQNNLPKGRNGVMGCTTQRYYKKEANNGKKSNQRNTQKRRGRKAGTVK